MPPLYKGAGDSLMRRAASGLLAVLVAMLVNAASAPAADPSRAIFDRRKALDEGEQRWADRYQQMKMVIRDGGGERRRELDVFEKRPGGGEQKARVFLREPAEVRGVGFLAFDYRDKPTEQWLYLPNLKRVRRITADTRNERFVGSDLTFHDLDLLTEITSWSEAEATTVLRGEEAIEGVACYAIDIAPKRADVQYKHIVLWLGRDDLVPRQVELYETSAEGDGWLGWATGGDAKRRLVKRVRQSEVLEVDKIPFPHRVVVESIARNGRTEIAIEKLEINQNLPDSLFTQHALEDPPKPR